MRPYTAGLILFLAVFLTISACASTSATYSPAAAREITSLKSRSLTLMEKAESPFSEHDMSVRNLQRDLSQALGRSQARPQNTVSTRQWEILIDPQRHLLGGFLVRWQNEEFLHSTFIVETRVLVAAAFDQLALREKQKTGAPR